MAIGITRHSCLDSVSARAATALFAAARPGAAAVMSVAPASFLMPRVLRDLAKIYACLQSTFL